MQYKSYTFAVIIKLKDRARTYFCTSLGKNEQ